MGNEIDIPETLQEAMVRFSDKDFAHSVAVAIVWPDGVPTCKHCGSTNAHFMANYYRFRCRACRKDFTVKNGTIFEDSPLGLDKWMLAMWMIANCKNGISSYEIKRGLGVCQKTAWFLLHRIREAMRTGSFRKLSGEIEADETYVGGKSKGKPGRGASGKTIVMGVLERGTNGAKSRVKARVAKNAGRNVLQGNIKETVETGSSIYTDAWSGYTGLTGTFAHSFVDHTVQYANGVIHTNGLENFWSLLKRGIRGTYVSVEPFHLDAYIDEQAFRFNERHVSDSERFLKVLGQVGGRRLTWNDLTEDGEDFYTPYLPA